MVVDDILFGAKRAYWGTFRFSSRKLRSFGITPARLNLLRVIYAAPTRAISQQYLRHHLGVARSVVCRMLRALEELELVERGQRFEYDRRTRMCWLTARGRELVASVWRELVSSRVIADEVDAIWPEPQVMRTAAEPIFAGLALSFGRWGPLRAP